MPTEPTDQQKNLAKTFAQVNAPPDSFFNEQSRIERRKEYLFGLHERLEQMRPEIVKNGVGSVWFKFPPEFRDHRGYPTDRVGHVPGRGFYLGREGKEMKMFPSLKILPIYRAGMNALNRDQGFAEGYEAKKNYLFYGALDPQELDYFTRTNFVHQMRKDLEDGNLVGIEYICNGFPYDQRYRADPFALSVTVPKELGYKLVSILEEDPWAAEYLLQILFPGITGTEDHKSKVLRYKANVLEYHDDDTGRVIPKTYLGPKGPVSIGEVEPARADQMRAGDFSFLKEETANGGNQ